MARGFLRPAIVRSTSAVDVSAMYENGFRPDFILNPSAGLNYKEVGSSNTSLIPHLGESTGTFTRSDGATYVDDDDNYVKVSAHEPRVFNGRLLMEPQKEQFLTSPESPSTQTTGSLSTGFYTLSMVGSGSVDVAANTATIDAAGTATEGSPYTFEVTASGSVDVTVNNTVDRFQLEDGEFATSIITSQGTRSQDDLDPASNYTEVYDSSKGLTLYVKCKLLFDTGSGTGGRMLEVEADANNRLTIRANSSGFIFLESEVGGTIESDSNILSASRGDAIEVALREQPSGFAVQYSVNDGTVQNPSTSLSTNHSDGLQWSKVLVEAPGMELIGAAVAQGDITLTQMRTLIHNPGN